MSVEEYFADTKPWERSIFDVVSGDLSELEGGDLIVDPIAMGIMFKNGPMLCDLRAKTKWTALGFSLARKLSSKKLSRKVVAYAPSGKFFHVINQSDPQQIDDEILDWLTEADHLPVGGPLEVLIPWCQTTSTTISSIEPANRCNPLHWHFGEDALEANVFQFRSDQPAG